MNQHFVDMLRFLFSEGVLLGAGPERGVVVDRVENLYLLLREILRRDHALAFEEVTRDVAVLGTQHICVPDLLLFRVDTLLVCKIHAHDCSL